MDNQEIKPVLDIDFLQKKANEYALKGAEEAIKNFYTGYSSPYVKAIEENLKNKAVDNNFDLPDVLALINDKLSQEIDLIANNAVAKTYIPLVKKILTRENSEIKFSDILKEFIKKTNFDPDEDHILDYTVECVDRYNLSSSLRTTFPTYQISNGTDGYELHLYDSKNNSGEGTLTLISIPYTLNENSKYYRTSNFNNKTTITLEGGGKIEMPFVSGILEDEFLSFCARLVIGNNNIIMDCTDFDEDMFPEKECHC